MMSRVRMTGLWKRKGKIELPVWVTLTRSPKGVRTAAHGAEATAGTRLAMARCPPDPGHRISGSRWLVAATKMVYRGGCGSGFDDEHASPSATMSGSRSASTPSIEEGAMRWRISWVLMCR